MNMSVIQNKNLKNIFNYWSNKITINLTFNIKIGGNMKKTTLKEMLENEFILGLRKIKGINKNTNIRKYNRT